MAPRRPRVYLGEMVSEQLHGCVVEADDAAAPRFGLLLDDDAAAGVVDRVVDDEFVPVEAQAVPSEAGEFAAPQARCRTELEHRSKDLVVLVGGVEEPQ